MPESLGRRVAALRSKLGWTQQELADRLAVSRVAVSHLEAGMTDPGERTVALLAGAFHLEPIELVEATSYPVAKAERLPLVAARYTEVELQVALMRRDLEWAARLAGETSTGCVAMQLRRTWLCRLGALSSAVDDPRERRLLDDARSELTG